MDEKVSKKYPCLPPNYVTITQLRERWIREKEEMKLKDKDESKQETENLGSEDQNQRSVCDLWPDQSGENGSSGIEEPSDLKAGAIGNGIGKEINVGCSKSCDIKKKKKYKKMKKKSNYLETKTCRADGENGNGDTMKVEVESEEKANRGSEEGFDSNEVNNGRFSKMEIGVMDETCRGSREKAVKYDAGNRRQEYRVKQTGFRMSESLGLKLGNEALKIQSAGSSFKLVGSRGIGDNLKVSGSEIFEFKTNGVELQIENKDEDELSEACSQGEEVDTERTKGMTEIQKHGVGGEVSNECRNSVKNNVAYDVLVEESGNDKGKESVGQGYRGHRRWNGGSDRKFRNFMGNDSKGFARSLVGSKIDGRGSSSFRRFENRQNMKLKSRDSTMAWVKKENSDATIGILADQQ